MEYHLAAGWIVVIVVAALWDTTWKAFALWRASRRAEPLWFAVLLILNTAGILPILYLLTHRQRPNTGESNR